MITSTTIAGLPVWLCLATPIWDSIGATFELPVNTEIGLTAREARTPLASRLRVSKYKFTAILEAGQVNEWRNWQQQLGNTPVAMPFWPAAGTPDLPVLMDAAFYVQLDADGGVMGIIALDDRPDSLDEGERLVPLLIGRLNINNPQMVDGERAVVGVDFVENSKLSWIAAPTVSFPTGPGGSGVLFPLRPDWTTKPKAGSAEVQVTRATVGYGRETSDTYYDQPAVRPVEVVVTASAESEWLSLLAFFADRRASVGSFWAPAALNETRLTADVASSDTSLTVDDAGRLGSNRHLILDDGVDRVLVIATAATNPVPLTGAVGERFEAAFTRIESLMLARFAEPSLDVTWANRLNAAATIKWRETPAEYSPDSGETLGVTLGQRPDTAFLYAFTILYPGAPAVSRFTAFESDLSDGTHTWTAAAIEHGDISETLGLDKSTVSLKTRNFPGNPLAMYFPFSLEFPLQIEIFEAKVVAGAISGTPLRFFIGEVGDVPGDGPLMSTQAASLGSLFDRQIPRFLYSTQCNYCVFHDGCPAVEADFEVSATVNAAVSGSTTVYVRKPSGSWAPGDYPAHDFAEGLLTAVIGGALVQRLIADSTAPDGSGIVTLTLSNPLSLASGATVTLLPGCDGSYGRCGRFDAQESFGGFPFMPTSNPSMIKVTSTAGGGKKG